MTKVAKRTVSKATSFFLILAGVFVVLFQKTPINKDANGLAAVFGSQTAHADWSVASCGGSSSCAEGTCEGCSGCGTDACGADNGGCSGGSSCGGY